ncbi:hypothetical protein [Halorientalis sp.]|uniref:hypothetical protein n=1 Tax=Halorientalis sp. TaxID=1931229 RepID=UPI002602CC5F|nr:hypothetical protein [Halorientalis sp.]
MDAAAVIGGGSTALSTAICTTRTDRRTPVSDGSGGRVHDVDVIENVCGFPGSVTGPELVGFGQQHARKSGAENTAGEVVRMDADTATRHTATAAGEDAVEQDRSTPAECVSTADVTGRHRQIATSVDEGARATIDRLEQRRGADSLDGRETEVGPA